MSDSRRAVVVLIALFAASFLPLSARGEPGSAGAATPGNSITVTPRADVSVTSDSNPALSPTNANSGVFGELTLEALLRLELEGHRVDAGAYGFTRRYLDGGEGEQDHTGGGERVRLLSDPERKTRVRAVQSWQRVSDYSRRAWDPEGIVDPGIAPLQEDSTARTQRDLLDTVLELARDLTDRIELLLGLGYDKTAFDRAEYFDWSERRGYAELGYGVTDKSQVFVTGRFAKQESEALSVKPDSKIWRAGWKTRPTAKTAVKAAVGVETYGYRAAGANGEATDESFLNYEVAGSWRPTGRFRVQLLGGNSITPSAVERNDTRKSNQAELNVAYGVTEALSCSVGVAARTDRYRLARIAGEEPRTLDSFAWNVGACYAPPGHAYCLYAGVSREDTDSNLPNDDFEQTRSTVGMRLEY
jgi:hypothetical protein